MPFNNNFGYPYYNNMMNMNMNNASPQPSGLTQVVGLQGAKAYQTSPNTTVALFDSDEDIFYVKTTDSIGNSNVRVFDFQERKDSDKPDYVTKEEFQKLDSKMDNLLEVLYGKLSVSETRPNINEQLSTNSTDGSSGTTETTRRRKPASTV